MQLENIEKQPKLGSGPLIGMRCWAGGLRFEQGFRCADKTLMAEARIDKKNALLEAFFSRLTMDVLCIYEHEDLWQDQQARATYGVQGY